MRTPGTGLILYPRNHTERRPADAREFRTGALALAAHFGFTRSNQRVCFENHVADINDEIVLRDREAAPHERSLAFLQKCLAAAGGNRTARTEVQRIVLATASRRTVLSSLNPALTMLVTLIANNASVDTAPLRTEVTRLQGIIDPLHAQASQLLNADPNVIALRNTPSVMQPTRQAVLNAIADAPDGLDMIAYFGHGLSDALNTAGFFPAQMGTLADAIRPKANHGIRITLYACEAGDRSGPAEFLFRQLYDKAPTIDAHTSTAHTWRNPDVVRYCGAQLGEPIVPRSHAARRAQWIARLKKANDPLWMEFPFMTQEEINAALDAPPPRGTTNARI